MRSSPASACGARSQLRTVRWPCRVAYGMRTATWPREPLGVRAVSARRSVAPGARRSGSSSATRAYASQRPPGRATVLGRAARSLPSAVGASGRPTSSSPSRLRSTRWAAPLAPPAVTSKVSPPAESATPSARSEAPRPAGMVLPWFMVSGQTVMGLLWLRASGDSLSIGQLRNVEAGVVHVALGAPAPAVLPAGHRQTGPAGLRRLRETLEGDGDEEAVRGVVPAAVHVGVDTRARDALCRRA